MEIPDKGLLHPLPARDQPAEGPQQPLQTESNGFHRKNIEEDTVRLTEKGREVKRAVNDAQLLPEIRADRVMQLKRQLAEGTYRVQGDRVAVSMIDETIENNKVLKQIDTQV